MNKQRDKERLMLALEVDLQALVEAALRWPIGDVPERTLQQFQLRARRVLRNYFMALHKLEAA